MTNDNEILGTLNKLENVQYQIGLAHGAGKTNERKEVMALHHQSNELRNLITRLYANN